MSSILRIVIVLGLAMGTLPASAQTDRFDIAGIVKALNEKDLAYLLQRKADTARLGDLPYLADQEILQAVLSKYAPIASYQIKSIDSNLTQYRVNTETVYQTGRTGKPAFVFDKNGKWVLLDIIRTKKEIDPVPAQQQSLSKGIFPDTVYTKFVLNSGLIYLPARVGDVDGYFMLDNGAPMVIFNKTYVPENKIDATHYTTMQGIGGGFGNTGMAKLSVKIGNILVDSVEAPVVDMPDYNAMLPMKIFGLLGYEFYKNYSLVINYQTQELLFIKRAKGQKPGTNISIAGKKYNALETVPLTLQRHIAIVNLSFDGKQYQFGIDCGANANLFKESLLNNIQSHFDADESEVSITGMGDAKGKGNVGYIMKAFAGKQPLDDMYTVFSAQKIGAGSGENELQIQGLLGTPFLNLHVTEIDYVNQRLILYKQ